ncbi:hypothetical protein D3C72_2212150 [compost metagenome]
MPTVVSVADSILNGDHLVIAKSGDTLLLFNQTRNVVGVHDGGIEAGSHGLKLIGRKTIQIFNTLVTKDDFLLFDIKDVNTARDNVVDLFNEVFLL